MLRWQRVYFKFIFKFLVFLQFSFKNNVQYYNSFGLEKICLVIFEIKFKIKTENIERIGFSWNLSKVLVCGENLIKILIFGGDLTYRTIWVGSQSTYLNVRGAGDIWRNWILKLVYNIVMVWEILNQSFRDIFYF